MTTSNQTTQPLADLARALVSPGKGILAADESAGTIKKRFEAIKLEPTEENGRRYREMLFTTPGAAQYVSGVILFDATIRQSTRTGVRFVELLAQQGIIPGIKVDAGTKPLAGSPREKISEGLDGLRERLVAYREMGAKFAKWRAVIDIAAEIPSALALRANAEVLARYAALCQQEGIVPIVEPEVLMDGDHTLARCEQVTTETLHTVFEALYAHRVELEGMLLKPNMVIAGALCPTQATAEEIATATIRCFLRTVPAAVPGIVFLSGGQGDVQATENLDAINRRGSLPWPVSFSYGRALQAASIKAWAGRDENIGPGQAAYLHRAHMNGIARAGQWTANAER
ncbi:MAG TPA: class I fructose-bisphosphate aldolase [Kofleriaceae bacterium]|jgi:fructose-bisphosphate aldolase class I|nr:class I fructose-bisphosphate aldolase [Kofleriaceae bacterium]